MLVVFFNIPANMSNKGWANTFKQEEEYMEVVLSEKQDALF